MIEVADLSCRQDDRYRSAWIVVFSQQVEEMAREFAADPWDVRMELALKLEASSVNISRVFLQIAKCNEVEYNFFCVRCSRNQFLPTAITKALKAVRVKAKDWGKLLDADTERTLRTDMVQLIPIVKHKRKRPSTSSNCDDDDDDAIENKGAGGGTRTKHAAAVDRATMAAQQLLQQQAVAEQHKQAALSVENMKVAVQALCCDASATAVMSALLKQKKHIADTACDALLKMAATDQALVTKVSTPVSL
jgi:hypothetical protein